MVQAALADMVMQVEAARLLIYRAARNAGTGAPVPLEASIAKCFAMLGDILLTKRLQSGSARLHRVGLRAGHGDCAWLLCFRFLHRFGAAPRP